MIKTTTITHITALFGLILTLLNSITLTGVDFFNSVFPMCALITSNYFLDKLNRVMLESCRSHHKTVKELYRKNDAIQNQIITTLIERVEKLTTENKKLKESKC